MLQITFRIILFRIVRLLFEITVAEVIDEIILPFLPVIFINPVTYKAKFRDKIYYFE